MHRSFCWFCCAAAHTCISMLFFVLQLEKLITLMNDQKIGVPLQNKKHLLSTIHSSFSGKNKIDVRDGLKIVSQG